MSSQGMQGIYSVDIVMCIDATGSMAPVLNLVKNNALTFYETLSEKMDEAGKSVDTIRVKVIAFRDYIIDAEPMKESPFFTLPDESAAFRDFVGAIEATGGGDTPECAYEAISRALASDWTVEGLKQRHVVLVFTDAPALALGERADCPGYPANMPKDLGQLGARWEGFDQMFVTTYKKKAGRLVVFAPKDASWEALETWNRYWPAYSTAGTGLDDVDMETVYDLLVGSC